MIMEDRGVDKNAFIELQERTKRDIHTASDSMELFFRLLRAHKLGTAFGLDFIIHHLRKIGMGFKHEKNVTVLKDPFIDRLIHFAKNHVLRDVKHGARIPIPDSYLLVGVADEGPAYEAEGVENVYCLKENEIFGETTLAQRVQRLLTINVFIACVQHPDDEEPTYIKGKRERFLTIALPQRSCDQARWSSRGALLFILAMVSLDPNHC